jgi:hypothetical protein
MTVTAVSFVSKGNVLEIGLDIENLSGSSIPGIDFEFCESALVKLRSLRPIENRVEAKSVVHHKFSVEVEELVIVQIVKLLIIPNGGDVNTLDTRLRIFPTHFFVPAGLDAQEFAEKQAIAVYEKSCPLRKSVCESLQIVANVFQGIVREIDEDGKSFVMIAKWVKGRFAVCSIAFREDSVDIVVKTSNATLSESVARELDMRLRRD